MQDSRYTPELIGDFRREAAVLVAVLQHQAQFIPVAENSGLILPIGKLGPS
jgi:hypothetical protein